MKKLFLALVCFASVAFFASCNGGGDPTITLNADKTSIASGETVAFTIQADANAETMKNITTVKIDVVLNSENLYTDAFEVNAATYSNVVELKLEGNEGDAFEVSATATDEAGKTAKATVTVTIEAGALVLVESPFTWNRHGGDAATGLDTFGLEWNSNNSKAIYAIITPAAGAKLYRFTTAQYVAALTQSLKEALFEGATEITEWKEFNVAGQQQQDLDVVLGTEYQGVFHLIHITHGEYSTFKGTDATITGMAK